MWLLVTLVGFPFLESFVILDSFPTKNQEKVGKNIPKKRHFLHANRIM